MVKSIKTGQDIAEKIALPAVLVISLLTAQLVIGLRSIVRLSKPIELSRSGLSVSMPQNNGWQCEEKWVYDGEGFTVSSIFLVKADSERSYARCNYLLSAKNETPQQRFSDYAGTIEGEVAETGQAQAGELAPNQNGSGLVVDWARIRGDVGRTAHIPIEIILGVCRLPADRYLEIEVLTTEGEKDLAQNIFDAIIKGIKFRDNGLLQAGIQIVGEVKREGLDTIQNAENRPVSLFVLTDAAGHTMGFTMEAMETQAGEESTVRAASYYYRRTPSPEEEVGIFQGNNTFEKFNWKVESRTGARAKRTEISAEDNLLLIGGENRESEYVLSKAAVPDIITEPVLRKFLDSNEGTAIIDVIRSDGTISPIYAEKTEPVQDNNQVIRIEVLDGRGIRQQIYYDSSKKQTKILLIQDGSYTFTRSTAEQIAAAFPERANLVLGRDHLLDKEGI